MNKILWLVLGAVSLAWAVPAELFAQGCTRCGRSCTTQQVCRTIYTTKSVEYTEWGEVCEEARLDPKTHGGLCGTCDSCDSGDCSSAGCDSFGGSEKGNALFGFFRQLSSCETRPRARLMRKTLVKQVPVVECVVEDVCDYCQQSEMGATSFTATAGWSGSVGNTSPMAVEANAPFYGSVQASPAFYQQVNEPKPFFQTVGAEFPAAATLPTVQPTLTTPVPSTVETPYNYFPLTRQPTETWVR